MLEIEVRPSAALQRKIDALMTTQRNFPAMVSQVVRDSAMSVVARATNYAPHATGALIRSFQKPIFLASGFAAVIGSWLPYAAKQEFDATLNHKQRVAKIRKIDTKAGKKGSIIKGTNQDNPNAQYGFLRRGLHEEKEFFIQHLQAIVNRFGDALRA